MSYRSRKWHKYRDVIGIWVITSSIFLDGHFHLSSSFDGKEVVCTSGKMVSESMLMLSSQLSTLIHPFRHLVTHRSYRLENARIKSHIFLRKPIFIFSINHTKRHYHMAKSLHNSTRSRSKDYCILELCHSCWLTEMWSWVITFTRCLICTLVSFSHVHCLLCSLPKTLKLA